MLPEKKGMGTPKKEGQKERGNRLKERKVRILCGMGSEYCIVACILQVDRWKLAGGGCHGRLSYGSEWDRFDQLACSTHTHTHSVLHSSLDFDAINRMKVHRGILFVPIGGGTCRDVGKEQREFPWNRWLIMERRYGRSWIPVVLL